MEKHVIGLLFILAGVVYGSLAIDSFYDHTLGWLVKNDWIKPPVPPKSNEKPLLGRKETIYLYSIILILIGLFILWKL
jgi:hypothetical protein